MSYNLFLAVILLIAVILILIVMVQNPKGGGLSSSFGGGLSFSGGAGISLLEQGIIEGENPVCDLRSSGLVSTSWRVRLFEIAALNGW